MENQVYVERLRGRDKVQKGGRQFVERGNGVILTMQIFDGELILGGERELVNDVCDDTDMCAKIKSKLRQHSLWKESYSYTEVKVEVLEEVNITHDNIALPKLFAKVGGKKWKSKQVHAQCSKYFKLLGYGSKAGLKYGDQSSKPKWWNETLPSWIMYQGPSKSTADVSTKIIEAILKDFGFDQNVHIEEGGELSEEEEMPNNPSKKRKKGYWQS